jgi:hypothetical protein
MMTNLGNAILLSAIASKSVPFLGLTTAGGVAAGAALIAFGGVLKGLAGGIGGGSSPSSGQANFGGGSAFGTPTEQPEAAGNTFVTVIQGFNTIEDLARATAESNGLAADRGYSYA